MDFNPVRGTVDHLPATARVRNYAKDVIMKTYSEFGFLPVKTPIMEDINLLCGSEGGDNLHLIFKILKRGEKLDLQSAKNENDLADMGLRYDLTVPLARFYCNNSHLLPVPFKSIQIDESFRAERPQKGRLRQFTQCDIDIFGSDSVTSEIEVINVSALALINLGFENILFKVSDRRVLNQLITISGFKEEDITRVAIILDKLDKIGFEGIEKELNETGGGSQTGKLISNLMLIQKEGLGALKKIGISSEYTSSLSKIIDSVNSLSDGKYKAVFDITIIRGQGYYTSSVYEIYLDGFSGACGGGGRYDNMIEKFSGKKVPAVGISIGFERICLILKEKDFNIKGKELLAVIYDDETKFKEAFCLTKKLSQEFCVNCVLKAKNMSAQLKSLKLNGFTKWMNFDDKIIKEIN